jgi:putative FmdB family regulatory protein
MPIYEYRCANCGHDVEVLQKLSEAPLVKCPQCGTDNLKKRISAAGFRLKGGGWYETDFKSGSKKNVTSTDSAPSSKSSNDSKSSGSTSAGSSSSSSD